MLLFQTPVGVLQALGIVISWRRAHPSPIVLVSVVCLISNYQLGLLVQSTNRVIFELTVSFGINMTTKIPIASFAIICSTFSGLEGKWLLETKTAEQLPTPGALNPAWNNPALSDI